MLNKINKNDPGWDGMGWGGALLLYHILTILSATTTL